jgi:hypothetical protein
MRKRDDFNAVTKKALAERAGYHCSRPDCRQLTIGPSDESPDARSRIGVASHICAASAGRGARRYDSQMSPADRRSIANGIWLCQNCAKLIDTDETRFPAELLREWRRNAEKRARQQVESTSLTGASEPIKSPLVAWIRVLTEPNRFPLILAVWLRNDGAKTLRHLRVRLHHCETHTVASAPDEEWWRQTSPSLNPWNLECTKPINPGETLLINGVPFYPMPTGEIWVRLEITAQDMQPLRLVSRFLAADLNFEHEQRFQFDSE